MLIHNGASINKRAKFHVHILGRLFSGSEGGIIIIIIIIISFLFLENLPPSRQFDWGVDVAEAGGNFDHSLQMEPIPVDIDTLLLDHSQTSTTRMVSRLKGLAT